MKKQLVLLIILALFAINAGDVLAQATSSSAQEVASKTVYSCPMHPEVKSSKRGKCPKCKMDLVKQTAATAVTDSEPVKASSSKTLRIPDVEVLDQDGNVRHFYTELIKGKTVVINFIFTNCTTICPPLGATFARVQKELGNKDVQFISVSVDPLTDTPERLKAWGAKFKAGTGWTFVTGNKPEIDRLLLALGASAARREDHTPSVIIGNDTLDVWTRTYGLSKTTQMVALIENVMAGRVDDAIAKESVKP
ncbi:MAG TPA: SCO family protein [Pyrinomonadaceae bacterium]|nr:SCO family protein [Pyrinomonadaceae bacterium]